MNLSSYRISQLLPSGRLPPLSFALLWLGAWAMLLAQLAAEWWRNPQYGYGLVVPILCAWILWNRRGELAQEFAGPVATTPCTTRAWAFLLLGAISLLPLELLRGVSPQLRSIGIYGTALCLVLTFWTLRRMGWRRMPPVVVGVALLFITAVPWPTTIEVWVTQTLMKGIASFTTDMVCFGGILAKQRGNLIELQTGTLNVEEACSGVRSLQSCVMASVAIGQICRLRWLPQAMLLAGGAILALVGNFFRTLTLTLWVSSLGTESVKHFHDPAGLLILAGVLVVLFWIGKQMAKTGSRQDSLLTQMPFRNCPMEGDAPSSPSETAATTERRPPKKSAWPDFSGLPRVGGVCLVAVVSMVGAHIWYWSQDAKWPPDNEPFLTLKSAPDAQTEEVPVPASILKILEPSQAAFFQCHLSGLDDVKVYSFFWLPNTDNLVGFYHRPDVCMSGAGWEMKGEAREITARINGLETVWYVFSFERDQHSLIQAWGVWRDGVQQRLNFSRGWRSLGGRHLQIWRYVLDGRRMSNTQIVSVILDTPGADDAQLKRMIGRIFTAKPRGRL